MTGSTERRARFPVTETEFEGVFSVTNYPRNLTSDLFNRSILVYRRWILLTISIPAPPHPATANIPEEGRGGEVVRCIKAEKHVGEERGGMEETPKALSSRNVGTYVTPFYFVIVFPELFVRLCEHTARKLTISLDATPFTYRRHVPRFLFSSCPASLSAPSTILHSAVSLAFDLLFRRVIFVSRLERQVCRKVSPGFWNDIFTPLLFSFAFNNRRHFRILPLLFLDYVSRFLLFCFCVITRYWRFSNSVFFLLFFKDIDYILDFKEKICDLIILNYQTNVIKIVLTKFF